MAAGLPLPAKHESLLAELLFSQMLRVPQAQLKPLAYSTLMVRRFIISCCRELLSSTDTRFHVLASRDPGF